jgi:predicted  nucleic acid-binding Zn-ribbon protein
MASISNIGTTASPGASGTSSIDNQIAVMDRRLERARDMLTKVEGADMATDVKAERMASYRTQIVTLTDQAQSLEQKRIKDQQTASGEAAEKSASQKDALSARTEALKAAGGTPRQGVAGNIVDVYA